MIEFLRTVIGICNKNGGIFATRACAVFVRRPTTPHDCAADLFGPRGGKFASQATRIALPHFPTPLFQTILPLKRALGGTPSQRLVILIPY
ncbi:hypothetical protein DGI_3254 [Megalodesulfovibrio gigas DSM 1382 = ATCC 19364]|uniref:Uncharacterized protein n=1 Tax=Megalodesulfovibrio gigas (strain ATCC 19364 / DSM 1382 / NCIMB 9332 / VKM B-1759) TaxID=1121448 RepID=T2GFN3_MEGG1|nr:hypothetical protein DGI_3254 [Megalodesulfovibrio gigas DSM 1382 = ATCC 19364]